MITSHGKARTYLSLQDKLKIANWLEENREVVKTMPFGEIRENLRRKARVELSPNSLLLILKQLKITYLVQGKGVKKSGKLQGPNDTPVLALALLSIMRAIDSKLDPGVQTKLLEMINRDNPQEQAHEEAAEKPEVPEAGGHIGGGDAKTGKEGKAPGKKSGKERAAAAARNSQSNAGSGTTH